MNFHRAVLIFMKLSAVSDDLVSVVERRALPTTESANVIVIFHSRADSGKMRGYDAAYLGVRLLFHV